MAEVAVALRNNRLGVDTHVFEFYTAAALTAAAKKYEWVIPFDCKLVDVLVYSNLGGSGGTSTIFDVNYDATTIYTTQANRPTLAEANAGMYAEAGEPEITNFRAGHILAVDVDQITTTGPTETSVSIIVTAR